MNNLCWLTHKPVLFVLFHFLCFVKKKKKGNVKQKRLVFRLLTEAQQPFLHLSLQALKQKPKVGHSTAFSHRDTGITA